MNCCNCEAEVYYPDEHYEKHLIVSVSGTTYYMVWTCNAVDWKARALAAEARLAELELSPFEKVVLGACSLRTEDVATHRLINRLIGATDT